MARFALKQTIETAEPTIAVDPGLPPGRHRFELVVIDDAGKRSQPVEAIVEIQPEIVPPPPVIRTDPRAGAVRPPVDPTLGASVAPPRFAHSGGEPLGTPDSDPAPARRKRSRKPRKPPAKKPRRSRRKE
jgi:hypothetical protein